MVLFTILMIIFRMFLILVSLFYAYKKNWTLFKYPILIFVLSFLPDVFTFFFDIHVDWFGIFLYQTVITMSLYFGSALAYYDKYAWWDRLVHCLSGITCVNFGVAIASKVEFLSTFPILFFSVIFSFAISSIWEILEYSADSIFHTNHQRWQKIHASVNHKSDKAIQPAGLVDTMNDSIVHTLSTFLCATIWWFILS